MIIASNFKYSSRNFLDNRQQCKSLIELEMNLNNNLYPLGFEVYCIQEKKWYQNVAETEYDTPMWEERKGGVGGNGSSIDISDIISDEEVSDRKTWSSEYIYSLQSNLEQLITNNEDYITEIEDRLLLVEGELMLLDGFNGSYDSLTNKPTIPSIEGLATETYVNNAIANAQLGGGEGGSVDLSGYATKDDLNTKADINDIPTKISQLDNDSNYLTEIPNEYITEDELNAKNYLTEHQNISHLATKEELNAKANVSDIPINISQLTNDSNFISSIPSEYITETELEDKGYLTEHQDISHLANRNELFSKDYNDLTNKPTIPSIDGLATETYVNNAIANAQLGGDGTDIDLSGYATKDDLDEKANISDIPINVSQLTNDSGYLTNVPSEYITETELEDKGYLTEHQNISHLATKEELNAKADTSSIPIKTSQLTNDSNFITSIPSEYITENELNNMGYLTEHQNISHLATKEELFSKDYNDLTNKPTIPSIEGLASETYVNNAVANIVDSAPETLNTLNELAEALGEDPNFATTITNSIGQKADKTELFSKDYNDLTNKPTIPTSTSQLTNDSNYATVSQIPSIPTSLPANGGNSDTVNGFSIWSGTQAEYDSIGTKSDTTIYLIRE